MKKLFILAILVGSALGLGLFYLVPGFCEAYSNKMQMPIFTGFITLGSFLLALKSFVIIQLKKELYERETYRKTYRALKTINSKLNLYDPLERLSRFLIYAVICALGTAFLQVTLGFWGTKWSAAACVGFASGTLVLVIIAWWNIKQNIQSMFKIWEQEANEQPAA